MTAAAIFKLIIFLLLLAILASLASGLFFMVKDKEGSTRTVTSLTVRVGLSIALFIMLFIGMVTGLIRPHGLVPPPPANVQTEKALPEEQRLLEK